MFYIYKYRQNYFQIWAIKRDNHKIFGFVNTYQEYDLLLRLIFAILNKLSPHLFVSDQK